MFDFDDLEEQDAKKQPENCCQFDERLPARADLHVTPEPLRSAEHHSSDEDLELWQKHSKDKIQCTEFSDERAGACGLCGERGALSHYCEDCEDNLCDACASMHREAKMFKGHSWRRLYLASDSASADKDQRVESDQTSSCGGQVTESVTSPGSIERTRTEVRSDLSESSSSGPSAEQPLRDDVGRRSTEHLASASPVGHMEHNLKEHVGARPASMQKTASPFAGGGYAKPTPSTASASLGSSKITCSFSCGDHTVIDGLSKRADLNGQWASCQTGVDPESGRIEVVASSGESVRLKAENLTKNELYKGTPVRIVGLNGRPELNGLVGILCDFDSAKGRWNVEMSDKSVLKLQPKCCVRTKLNAKAVVIKGDVSRLQWTPDMFGTKRGRCNKCGIKCPQYKVMNIKMNGCAMPASAVKALNCLVCGCDHQCHADLGKLDAAT